MPNGPLRHGGQGAPAHRAAAAGSGGGALIALALAHAPAIRQPVPALAALTAATFLYVTTEMLPVGLLAPIGADLGVSEARVGLLVTAYALVVVVASIPLTYLTLGGATAGAARHAAGRASCPRSAPPSPAATARSWRPGS